MGCGWMTGALTALLATGCAQDDGGAGGTGDGMGAVCDIHDPALFVVGSSLFKGETYQNDTFDYYPVDDASVSGTVTEVGTGPLPMICGIFEAGAEGAWIRLADADGATWTACYAAKGASMPLQVGDAVTADYTFRTQEWSWGEFTLTLRKDGALVLHATDGGHEKPKLPDGITMTTGQTLCTWHDNDGCGGERNEMTVAAGGESATIAPGETATVGGLEVHLGYWSKSVLEGGCDGEPFYRSFFVVAAP